MQVRLLFHVAEGMRLLSNIIKSTRVSVSSINKFNIEIMPIVNEIASDNVLVSEEVLDDSFIKANEQQIIALANQKAEEIILKANEKANDILTNAICNAEDEAEKIKQDAQKMGYDYGYNSAIEQIETLKAQAQLELENAIKQKEEILLSSEPQMVDMILKLSKTIFGKALEINPQVIMLLIKKALEQSTVNGKLYIHVSKEDYDCVIENVSQIYELSSNEEIEIIKDLTLTKGDCIIETPYGNVDSSFDMQFDAIKNDLIYILENR